MRISQTTNSKALLVAKGATHHPDPLQILGQEIVAMGFHTGGLYRGHPLGVSQRRIERLKPTKASRIRNCF
jgi:hypothetical protein